MGRKNTRYPEEFRNQIIKEVEEVGNATLVARKHDLVTGTVSSLISGNKFIAFCKKFFFSTRLIKFLVSWPSLSRLVKAS